MTIEYIYRLQYTAFGAGKPISRKHHLVRIIFFFNFNGYICVDEILTFLAFSDYSTLVRGNIPINNFIQFTI